MRNDETQEDAQPARAFGQRVRELRMARGWTQEQLAQVLSVGDRSYHQTTIAKLESGTRPTSVDELYAIADALGVTVADLFGSLSANVRARARKAAEMEALAAEIGELQARLRERQRAYDYAKAHYDRLATEGGE